MSDYTMREWFEVHWKLRYTAEQRKQALALWDAPEWQKSRFDPDIVPLDEQKFWLQNLIRELGESESAVGSDGSSR